MTSRAGLSRRAFLAASGSFLSLSIDRLLGQEPLRVPPIDERIKQLAENAPLTLKFTGTTAEEYRKWQGEFAGKLRALLGPHAPPTKWKTVIERSTDLADHRREDLVLTAEGVPPLPVYLLTPRDKTAKKRPGVLALHGHGSHGYDPVAGRDDLPGVAQSIASANYDYGRQFVRRGYVVAVPCFTPFGRRLGERSDKQDPCAIAFLRLQVLGKLLIAENLRDALWALDLLAKHDQVDPERLGCAGLSYGGRMTMLTTALEPRIKVAAVSGALNVFQERIRGGYSCGAQVIPGLLQIGDVPEIGSLIAPRPCVWEVGIRDSLAPEKWADEAATRMRRAYKALGAEDKLYVDRFEGGHQWNGKVAFPLFEKSL